jgi:NAD(P)-dependent dehydrogenase (short-subunit alcohol dehydrogenase family)
MATKIALVSGANKGIGREVAKQLGALGFKVYVGSRDLGRGEQAARELGATAQAIQLDVTDQASIDAAIAQITKDCGKLDVLINNAGIVNERTTDLQETKIELVEETMKTNFFGPFRLLKASVALLEKSDAPRVVNVSSTLGSITLGADANSPYFDFRIVGYNCSKAALNMLTVMSAGMLAGKKIKVNAICPGYVATDINNNEGVRSVEEGAAIVVKMATIGDDGPTAGFFDDNGVIAW